jgi:hypothetical protein
VDIADVNGNGIPEIFVTSINRQTIDSFVIEYRNGNYEVIEKGVRFMIRAISSMGTTRVLGQILAAESVKQENPFINPIHHVVWEGGRYTLGEKIRVPVGLSVYGLTLENIEGKSLERVITYDDYDYLRIYEKTDKLLIHLQSVMGSSELIWKSDEQYGGSNNFFKPQYATGTRNMVDVPDSIFMKQRILSYDLNKDGKNEIIVVKNLSAMGRVLKNVPLFTSAEIYNLEWDGLGLAEVWRTKKINGYVADYQIKDFDNDGQDEILLALVLSVGPTIRTNSCLVAYKLVQPSQSQAQPQAR